MFFERILLYIFKKISRPMELSKDTKREVLFGMTVKKDLWIDLGMNVESSVWKYWNVEK